MEKAYAQYKKANLTKNKKIKRVEFLKVQIKVPLSLKTGLKSRHRS